MVLRDKESFEEITNDEIEYIFKNEIRLSGDIAIRAY